MIQEVQGRARQTPACLKHPGGEQKESARKAVDLVKSQIANPMLFMTMVIKQRSAPQTEVVGKGQEAHRFSFGFPVVVKPFDGRPMILVRKQSELERVTRGLKAVGYQIQKYLQGYDFLKVRVLNGVVEDGHAPYVSGAVRRLVTLLVVQGVRNFTLTVATNHITTYIIGARLN